MHFRFVSTESSHKQIITVVAQSNAQRAENPNLPNFYLQCLSVIMFEEWSVLKNSEDLKNSHQTNPRLSESTSFCPFWRMTVNEASMKGAPTMCLKELLLCAPWSKERRLGEGNLHHAPKEELLKYEPPLSFSVMCPSPSCRLWFTFLLRERIRSGGGAVRKKIIFALQISVISYSAEKSSSQLTAYKGRDGIQ